MPLYEYRCSKCNRVFEVLQKFSDAPLEVHEGCGGSVERLISAPGLQFKGSGWYITDYKNAGPKSETKTEAKTGDKPADKSSESKSGDQKESKSAASETKTESKTTAEPAKK